MSTRERAKEVPFLVSFFPIQRLTDLELLTVEVNQISAELIIWPWRYQPGCSLRAFRRASQRRSQGGSARRYRSGYCSFWCDTLVDVQWGLWLWRGRTLRCLGYWSSYLSDDQRSPDSWQLQARTEQWNLEQGSALYWLRIYTMYWPSSWQKNNK